MLQVGVRCKIFITKELAADSSRIRSYVEDCCPETEIPDGKLEA
jgi:hypothetical protein